MKKLPEKSDITHPPTMQDIAHLAKVSPMTVSRALKPKTSVGKETRARVLAAAEQLGYVLNSNAASFASSKTGFVAVTIPSINNANFAETITALTESLRESGLHILLGYTNYSIKEEERLIEQFLQRRPEALVVTGGSHSERSRKLLAKAGVPIIEMWDAPQTPIDSFIGFSNADAARQMVDHFHALGLTKLAFIGGDTSQDTRGLDRRKGFVARLQELGLESHRMVSAGTPPITVREGAQSVRRLLKQWPDTQAVMCVSDLVAFGAISHCVRVGIDVPGQLAIAGFGAYDISELCNPPITTIDAKAALIGTLTGQKLRHRLGLARGEDMANHWVVPEIIIRQSTDAKAAATHE